MRFRRIAVIGAGLIGGSFALAARRAGLAELITAWDSAPVLDAALSRGVADAVEDSFQAGRICDADLIYLSAPVDVILQFLETNGKLIERGSIVTDAGSTKREICAAAARSLPPGVEFVGGHPMAGSHLHGLDNARDDLFQGAPYGIVAGAASHRAVSAVTEAVRTVGAVPISVSAEEHDRAVAVVSHLPQLLSTALSLAVAESPAGAKGLDFASSGFADMVRLAASRWSMWGDICRTNADNIAPLLRQLARRLESIGDELASGRLDDLEKQFRKASEFTAGFLASGSEFKL